MRRHILFLQTLILNTIFYAGVGFLEYSSVDIIPEIWLDKIIIFTPYAVYLYLSFFFLIWHAFLKVKEYNQLAFLIPLSAYFAAIFYLAYPTSIEHVLPIKTDIVTDFLYYLLNNDTHHNCLPSLHGAITVICVFYLLKSPVKYKILYVGWGLGICWSAVAVRQHLSLDIIAGIIYGIIIVVLNELKVKYGNKQVLHK